MITENAARVLRARYLRRDPLGKVVETPQQMFERVARAVSEAELLHGTAADARHWEERFHRHAHRARFPAQFAHADECGDASGATLRMFRAPD